MILKLENVTRKFGGLTAVDDVSFGVEKNQVLGLIGPNGSGKTTCFNLITGFLKPTSGTITFDGQVISGLPAHKIAKLGIARTFQISSIFPKLSALENVHTAHDSGYKHGYVSGLLHLPAALSEDKQSIEKSHELLDFCDLSRLKNKQAGSLTSADQRRLMVAIALATKPKLLMLDEPCAGMNHDEQVEMINLIRKVCDTGVSVLLVEHHMKMIMAVCHHVVVLNLGNKIAEGEPAEVQASEAVIEAYLGRSGTQSC